MKIQTNAGEVEMTAEMVCRGMVFQSDNWIQNHARDGVLTMLHDDPGNPGAWKATVEDSWCFPEHAQRFLGCDPAIATRADCERFGVHGDAAAHGFARLRDGGAVDLRRWMPKGAITEFDRQRSMPLPEDGLRLTAESCRFMSFAARFLGLDARYASPGDVERLCCGEKQNPWTLPAMEVGESRILRQPRCTLAIGPHDTHEDLATGAKWSAVPAWHEQMVAAMQYAASVHATAEAISAGFTITTAQAISGNTGGQYVPEIPPATFGGMSFPNVDLSGRSRERGCPGCGVGEGSRCHDGCPRMLAARTEWERTHCGAHPKPGQQLAGRSQGIAYGDELCGKGKAHEGVHADRMCGAEWTNGGPMATCDRCASPVVPTPERPPMQALAKDGDRMRRGFLCESCAKQGGEMEWRDGRLVAKGAPAERVFCGCGAIGPDIADHLHAKGCATVRERHEAPLVALVNAVPEGLDPIGWRAAVLAYCEHAADSIAARLAVAPSLLPQLILGEVTIACRAHVVAAYQRALAPRVKVEPERKRRGPVLPVDDGRDE